MTHGGTSVGVASRDTLEHTFIPLVVHWDSILLHNDCPVSRMFVHCQVSASKRQLMLYDNFINKTVNIFHRLIL